MASDLYEAKRNDTEAVAVWTVHIHFPAFAGLAAKDFYWATADNIELEDGNTYIRHLRQTPRGRHQTDRGNDYAEILVSDPDHSLYQEILPYEDLIEKCQITIREAFEIETDFYESEIRFFGYLKDFTLTDEDRSMQMTAFSDMSRTGFLVGNRVLTRERCGTEFSFGVEDPTTHTCGWVTNQGGNALFCSKKFEGVDGCEAHNNTHRFFAVPGLATADVQIVSDPGDGDPGGWGGSGSGSCFSEKTRVLMADWSLKPIHQVTTEDRHMGFDIFDNDVLKPGEVLDTFRTPVDEIHEAKFDMATFEVVKDHLFYLGERIFAPVAFLGDRPAIGINLAKKPARSFLMAIERHIEKLFVYNLRTSTHNYIVTDEKGLFLYFVHNVKPIIYNP